LNKGSKELLAEVTHNFKNNSISYGDYGFLVEYANKLQKENEEKDNIIEEYEKALDKIASRKMSTFLSEKHMTNNFIGTARNALNNNNN